MVELSVQGSTLEVRVKGLGKLWALRSRIRVPLHAVRAARHDPAAARGLWKGFRLPGTQLPGVITAGTFYKQRKRVFWSVRREERVVVIELGGGAPYDRLVVEVEDPAAALAMLRRATGLSDAATGKDRPPMTDNG